MRSSAPRSFGPAWLSSARTWRSREQELRLCDTAVFVLDLVHQLYKETLREDLWRKEVTFRSGVAVRYCSVAFRSEDRDVSKVFYLLAGRSSRRGLSPSGLSAQCRSTRARW